MTAAIECDVLVVGAGPTGVTLALLLARGGLDTLVIDKEPEIYALPRAAHIDHETMRTFQSLGIADAIAETCRSSRSYDFLNAAGEVLMRFDGLDEIGPGGWPVGNMIHQPSLEGALRGAARRQARLSLETKWAFASFEDGEDGVQTTVRTPRGAVRVRSRYLVGADGARSPVRAAAGIALNDLQFDEEWLVIDAIVHDFERLPKINLQICDPARPTTCVLMGCGRHRWEFMLLPGETPEQILASDSVARLLAPWKVDGAVSVERKVVYRFNARLARAWAKGRVLLAGDAAHLTPPFAGQGLCSGIRDAANLGWKLPAVLRGARRDLLDTYQVEREPNARAFIDLAMMMGRTVCMTDVEAARVRDEQMLAARAAGKTLPPPSMPGLAAGCIFDGGSNAGAYFPQPIADGRRLDDVLGPGAWLIGREAASVLPDTSPNPVPTNGAAFAPLSRQLSEWLSRHDADAVLVRPDRYIFGTGGADELEAAWRRWTQEPAGDAPAR